MGRLFWKVFLAFWLTMLAVSAVVALAVMTAQQARVDESGDVVPDGPAPIVDSRWVEEILRRNALVLEHGNSELLSEMLRASPAEPPPFNGRRRLRNSSVLVVDSEGRDILAREVPREALEQARARLGELDRAEGVMRVEAADGNTYLLFVPQRQGARRSRPEPPFYMRQPPAAFAAAGLAFSLVFSAALAWYLARPIRALRQGFEAVAAGDLGARVSPRIGRRRDELADLGRDFDLTTQRLQHLILAQRRLLHDVSHELRSPLARIQAAVGLLRQSPARAADLCDRVEQESRVLDDLVGEILTLARLDEEMGHGEAVPLELDELLADVVDDARFEAQGMNKTVDLEGSAPAGVEGYPVLLQRAAENLVRNALRHTAPGTAVTVTVGPTRLLSPPRKDEESSAVKRRPVEVAGVRVAVRDHGPGIPEDLLESVVDPFVRLPPEGTPDTAASGGFGLGLAITRRAMELHGGKLRLRNHPQGGLEATLEWPLAPNAEKLRTAELFRAPRDGGTTRA